MPDVGVASREASLSHGHCGSRSTCFEPRWLLCSTHVPFSAVFSSWSLASHLTLFSWVLFLSRYFWGLEVPILGWIKEGQRRLEGQPDFLCVFPREGLTQREGRAVKVGNLDSSPISAPN